MTRPTLQELGILQTNNGIWVHDCPHSEGDVMSRAQAQDHGRYLHDHGVTGVMLFGSTTKVQRALGYRDVGVSTVFRPWRDHKLGLAPDRFLMPADQVAQYVAVGTRVIQPFNEQNLPEEWINGPYHGLPPKNDWARIVIDTYEASLNAYGPVGAYSALPPLSPGGVYGFDHRECWDMMLNEISKRSGLKERIKVICLHPRPHNFPPNTPYNGITVAFKEYERYIATAKSAGIDAWFYAGEHGASIGAHDDPTLPPVDLQMWTDWNRTFYEWLNPAHPLTIKPEVFALAYWLSGDGGAWPADSIDQGKPPMPAPSPLWVWMIEHNDQLPDGWRPGGGEPPPPPPPGDLVIKDGTGAVRDWTWLHAKYGIGVHIKTPGVNRYWKIIGITENLGGSAAVTIKVAPGTKVVFWYSTAPQLPADINQEWDHVGAWGTVEPKGEIGFSMSPDAYYNKDVAPFCGPHNIWCGTSTEHSEQFVGEGMLPGTEHHHLDLEYALYEEPTPPPSDFRKPFDGEYKITCDFQCHKNRVPPSTSPGVDYATPLNTPALAVREGIVVGRGTNSVSGVWVMLMCYVCDGPNVGWHRFTYRHLTDYHVAYWAKVKAGDLIGHTGNTGASTGPHLHIDDRFNESSYIDPEGLW